MIFAAAVLALAGCAKEAAQVERTTIDGKEYMTFKVVAHDDVISTDTKATLSRTGVFGWEDGESIYFVDMLANSATGTYNAAAGTITVEAGDWLAASNAPFDSDSKIKDFGLANGPVVVAMVYSGTLNFYHIGSIINIKIDDIPIDGYLEFWTNDASTWDGGNFGFSGDVPVLNGGGLDEIYIKRPVTAADAGKDISLSVPNVNYDAGFTIALSGTTAQYFKKTTVTGYDLSTSPTLLNMAELSLPTYTIAGEQVALFGSSWDVADTNNDMTLDTDGLYKKTYSNAPDFINLKVVQNHAWGTEWPDGENYTKSITKVGGGITIKFNYGANSIAVDEFDMYTVAGEAGLCGSGWDTTDTDNDMEEVSDGVYYKKFTSVSAAESYQFKVVKNHSWAESWGGELSGNFVFKTDGSDVEVYFYPAVPSIKVVCDITPKYRVAGNSSVLFGTTWDTGNNANLMTDLGNGTYQISYVCPADEDGVAFKVTKDNSWDYAWPSSDYVVNVKAGQTLTIFYNPTTCAGNVTVE